MQRMAAIMAGGRGERLWPKSRTQLPKQFLSLGDGPSFLQQTHARLAGMDLPPGIFVLTAEATQDLVCAQLPELPRTHVLGEPLARDTAVTAALALAMARALAAGEAVLALVPADHAVFDVRAFRAALDLAWQAAEEDTCPVLIGIPPTRPETGYGYILKGAPIGGSGNLTHLNIGAFVEKPSLEKAQEFLASGHYLWNSGVCVCRTDVLLQALSTHQPELRRFVDALNGRSPTELAPDALATLMRPLRPVSLDYAVLERVDRATVIQAPLAWDDVGSWEALARMQPPDARGNVSVGPAVLSDTDRTVVYGSARGRLVVTHGVRDLVVVDTADSTLIVQRAALPGLKRALGAVRASGYDAHLDEAMVGPKRSEATDWGYVIDVPAHDTRMAFLRAGVPAPALAFAGAQVRLASGEARMIRGDGIARVWPVGRARQLPAGSCIISQSGCFLALEATVGEADAPDLDHVMSRHVVEKPWGREVWWAVNEAYVGKRLEVQAGHALSLQFHEAKHETLYLLSGEVRFRLGNREQLIGPGHVATVPPGTVHRIEAVSDAVLIEVSTPEVDDVERLEDRYNRSNGPTPTPTPVV